MSRRVRLLGWIASGLTLFFVASMTLAAEEAKPAYVGVNKCKMCHMKQYKAWATTKHAGAFAVLEKGDAKAIAEMAAKLKVDVKAGAAKTEGCVKCHVTGYKLAGGYPTGDATKDAAVINVTCENCHGPGGKHVSAPAAEKKAAINAAPAETVCKGCHTAEISPKFDYAKMKALVHPVPSGS